MAESVPKYLFVPRHFGVNSHSPGHSPLLRSGTLVKTSTSNLNSQQETTINMTLDFNMNIDFNMNSVVNVTRYSPWHTPWHTRHTSVLCQQGTTFGAQWHAQHPSSMLGTTVVAWLGGRVPVGSFFNLFSATCMLDNYSWYREEWHLEASGRRRGAKHRLCSVGCFQCSTHRSHFQNANAPYCRKFQRGGGGGGGILFPPSSGT